MATYRVTAPDGSRWDVNAPDGATEDAVMRYAQAQWSGKKNQAKQEPAQEQIEDPGFGQAALIGTGRTLDRLGKGIKQMGLNVAAPFSESARGELAGMAEQEGENSRLYKKLQDIRPGATMLGEAAPLVAAPMLGAGALATAASASLPGLVEYGTAQERLARGGMGAAGGVAGRAFGNFVARAIKPTQALSKTQQGAIDAADRLGVKLTSGEASGNRALRWAEAASADMPIAAGIASKRIAGNEKALSQAASRSIGQNADELTDAVLRSARDEISNEYSRILSPLKINLDKSFSAEVRAITGSKVMKELRDESVEKLIAPFRNLPNGKVSVTGEWFQQNKTALDDAIRSAFNSGQPGKARALERFESALDRAARRSMGQTESAAYDAAKRKWANLRLLETGKVVDGGKVLPGRLDSALGNRYKGAYKEGKIKGELPDIARLSGVLRQPPQSGTAPRAIYSGLIGGAAFADPTTAAAMVAAPSALQGLTASQAMRGYLTKGLMNLTPEEELMLLSAGGRAGLLGAYGANQ